MRRACLEALRGRAPLDGPLAVYLVIQAGAQRFDLDHNIAAIGNLLACAPVTAGLADVLSEPANADIHPSRPLAYWNDAPVKYIQAEHLTGDGSGPSGWWYAIRVTGYAPGRADENYERAALLPALCH